jgi:hypothetical protein
VTRPSPRSEDRIRRAFLVGRVKGNPGIHASTVNPDVDGRDVSRVLGDLLGEGKIAQSPDGRLYPAETRARRQNGA